MISNTKQAIDSIDCRVKILQTHHACQCGKKENKKWRLNKYCKLTMPMWANGRRRGSRRVWYCKQLRICSSKNIFYFIKHTSGNIFFPLCFHFVFIGVQTWGQKVMKWSPLLGVLKFRLEALEFEFWLVYNSSIHHYSHCFIIPLTAIIEWVASVIWGRAKTGTAVSR